MMPAVSVSLRTIVRSAVNRVPIPKRLRRVLSREVDGEAPSSWYDQVYAKGGAYAAHYAASRYYFLWAVIADRARRARAVLEVGCGSGQLAHLLHDQGIGKYLGFDFSKEAVALAKTRLPACDFRVDDARSTRLYATFDHDLVICTEVLEHIEEDVAVLTALRPGVRVIATVPNYDSASHVRYFRDADEVLGRYRALFDSVTVDVFMLDETNRFFLIDGIRRA
jgi:2-polyprenyl-3-methyl-5-hydroxy-6-metoxy-1,4-benzoquinol methylase